MSTFELLLTGTYEVSGNTITMLTETPANVGNYVLTHSNGELTEMVGNVPWVYRR